ncbi:MAG: sigma-70 family RNA polymerase sigma factor [Chloroflexota bacterium]
MHQRIGETESKHTAEVLTPTGMSIYCEEWYECCGADGNRREVAFGELARYLYDRAIYKFANGDSQIAEELTQDAIERVFHKLHECQIPGAFLAFANGKLWQVASNYFYRRDRDQARTQPLPGESDADVDDHEISQIMDSVQPSPVEEAFHAELGEELFRWMAEFLVKNKRLKNTVWVLVLTYVYDLSTKEIAEALNISENSVYILRHRAIDRLEKDPDLRRLWDEWTAQ